MKGIILCDISIEDSEEKERQDLRKDDDVFPCSFYGELFDSKQLILHVLPLIPPLQLETCF